jgi:transcriptional regulator with XRE-family HTH domain
VVPPTSPTVAGWELALRLRQRRTELGIDVRTITQELGFSRNYWSAIENERKVLSEEGLIKLVELFEFDRQEREELLELRAAAKERGWWTRFSAVLDDELQRLMGLEFGAHSVRCWESLLIPGLLQIEDYARSLMAPDVNVREVEVEQRVDVRMRRQARLTGDNPLRLTALISEAALHQEVGGRAVLRRQLDHLAKTIEQRSDTTDVRVLPFAASSYGLLGAATVYLIGFENSRLPTVIWQETVTSWGVIDDPTKVRDISGTYRKSLERAQSGRDSLKMIQNRMKELG